MGQPVAGSMAVTSRKVEAMRRHTILLGLLLALTPLAACSLFGSSQDDGKAQKTQRSVTARAQEALPLATDAVGGSNIDAEASWYECMQNLSWKYNGAGTFTASPDTVDNQLAAMKSALVAAGYEDVTQVEGHLSVTQGDFTLDLQQNPAYGPTTWVFSFESDCSPYSSADGAYISKDTGGPIEGLSP